mmetsp:Transcript_18484/g.29550  ORF Transcript_18484/g.29550 Transcript_18484/m.29550 type:complete len:202 (+) Transcript_18484:238-843(+)
MTLSWYSESLIASQASFHRSPNRLFIDTDSLYTFKLETVVLWEFSSPRVAPNPYPTNATMTLNIKKTSTIMVAKTSVQMSSEPTKHAVHVVLASVPVTMAEESTLTRRLYDSVSKLHSSGHRLLALASMAMGTSEATSQYAASIRIPIHMTRFRMTYTVRVLNSGQSAHGFFVFSSASARHSSTIVPSGISARYPYSAHSE